MNIIKLEIENVKRIRAVTIVPKDQVVTISGKNEMGKSSILDSIAMALGGKGQIPDEPLREGEEKGKIVMDLGKYLITRTFTKAGGGSLKVESKEGATFKSPQALLDSFFNDLTLNPMDFVKAQPKDQEQMLLKVADIPFEAKRLDEVSGLKTPINGFSILDQFDTVHKMIYDSRRDIGRELDRAKKAWESCKVTPEDEKLQPISIDDILAERKKIEVKVKERKDLDYNIMRTMDQMVVCQASLDEYDEQIKQVKSKIDDTLQSMDEIRGKKKFLEASLAAMPPADMGDLDKKISEAQAINSKVAEVTRKMELHTEWKKVEGDYKIIDERLEGVVKYRTEVLSKAKFPVPGLSFDENRMITLDGIPINQRGSSKMILVGVAIAVRLNPQVKVILIRDGNDLDSENMKRLSSFAHQSGYQVWIERCQDSADGVSFFISDGSIIDESSETTK